MKTSLHPESGSDSARPKPKFGKAWLYLGLAAIIATVSSYFTYTWQHQQVTALTGSLNAANHKVTFLTVQQTGLNKQLGNLNDSNNQLTGELNTAKAKPKTTSPSPTPTPSAAPPPSLTVSVLGAQKYTAPSDPNFPKVVVDVTLTNSTASPIVLPISSFQLKDEADDTSTDFAELAGTIMPNANVVLNDQTVAPGQSVTGALLFDVIDPNYLNFTLVYAGQTYPFTTN